MKKLMYIVTGLLIMSTGAVNAQKIGHVNSQEILLELPDYKAAEAQMKSYQEEKMADYEKMKAKYESMVTSYNVNKAKNTEAQNKLLEQDIMDYQNSIQEMEQNITTNLQKREQILMEPLIKKVKDAIAKVAKAQGLNYVLDTGTLIFMDGGTDITPLVKKDLMPAAPATNPGPTGGK